MQTGRGADMIPYYIIAIDWWLDVLTEAYDRQTGANVVDMADWKRRHRSFLRRNSQ